VAATPRPHETVSLAGVAAAGVLGLGLALCIAEPVLAVSAAGQHRARWSAPPSCWSGRLAINFIAQAWSTVPSCVSPAPSTTTTPADALVSGTVPLRSLAVLLAVLVAGTAVAGCWHAATSPPKGQP
jgi:hypothetical protein